MTSITVPLSEAQMKDLQELARRTNTSPEELARAGLAEWLGLRAKISLKYRGVFWRRTQSSIGGSRDPLSDAGRSPRLHRLLLEQSGGAAGSRDPAALASAIAQPQLTFDGLELYETLVEKASSLAYSLIMNHAFVDGN